MKMGETLEQAGTEEEYSLKQFQDEMAVFAAKESSGEIESGHFLISGTATRELKPGFDPSLLGRGGSRRLGKNKKRDHHTG